MKQHKHDPDYKLSLYQKQQFRKESGENLESEFSREIHPRRHFRNHDEGHEEFAAEIADSSRLRRAPDKTEVHDDLRIGWVALVTAIASLFVWPVVLGPAAAVLGFISFTRGSRAMGIWSMIIGFIAVFTALVLMPLYW